jgi:hypothetical protein
MDQKTPRIFNRKIADDGRGYNNIENNGSEDPIKILGKVSPMSELPDKASYDHDAGDEKKQSELTNHEVSGRFRAARGSGWIGPSTSAFSKSNTPNRRNHSTAQDVLEKLQQEAALGASHRKPSPMERMRNSNVQEAASSGVRYKFVSKPKTDAQVKKDKQRKWKEKMKIAQERKRQERLTLDGESSKKGKDQYGNAIISCVLDNVEQTDFFKQFTRCGDPVDEDSNYEVWSAGESSVATSDEDESAALSEIQARGELKRGRNPRPRLPSESSGQYSTDTSVETSVQEDMASLAVAKKVEPVKPITAGKKGEAAETIEKGHLKDSHVDVKLQSRSIASNEREADHRMVAKAGEVKLKPRVFPPSSIRPAHRASQSRHSASTMTTRPATPNKERNFINDFIEDLTTMGESMLWHKETAVMNPATVRIQLKKGYRGMDGTFCAPRLVWSDDSKGQKYGVDLFGIQSLTKADPLELENFPYAMPGRTVNLKIANGGSFILEARSEDDAFRFVRGIRWVVSRLAFNLVIGNVDVSCELLDLGLMESPGVSRPSSLMEFDWTRAMDDVADHLVEKTLAATMI